MIRRGLALDGKLPDPQLDLDPAPTPDAIAAAINEGRRLAREEWIGMQYVTTSTVGYSTASGAWNVFSTGVY